MCSDARVMWDNKTGRSRGYGFVSFRNQQARTTRTLLPLDFAELSPFSLMCLDTTVHLCSHYFCIYMFGSGELPVPELC